MKLDKSTRILIWGYIVIVSINLSSLSPSFVNGFNWAVLIGMAIFWIIMESLHLKSSLKGDSGRNKKW